MDIGNTYRVDIEGKEAKEGVFVSEDEDHVFLKLDSGYNIGIAKDSIISKQLIQEKEDEEGKDTKNISDPDILILHTGGTIASKVDYSTGAVTSKFTPEEVLDLFPGLEDYGVIDSTLISNMPSDDMNFHHYNKMGEVIEEAVKNKPSLKGIILTHGTDTLHYTTAALRFSLENLPIPVVVVGSQRSSDRPSSDAHMNLMNSAFSIEKLNAANKAGVFACMHGTSEDKTCTLYNGVNLRKNHTSRRDAFEQVNQEPIAEMNHEEDTFEFIREPQDSSGSFERKPFDTDKKVGLIKARPGLKPEELEPYQDFDALLLEGTGLGHMPINTFDDATKDNEVIYEFIKESAEQKPVGLTSQTIYGRINMNVYSPGRKLKEAGVLGHNTDMITETAYVKMHWLISNYDSEMVKELYDKNLRGEITTRTEYSN